MMSLMLFTDLATHMSVEPSRTYTVCIDENMQVTSIHAPGLGYDGPIKMIELASEFGVLSDEHERLWQMHNQETNNDELNAAAKEFPKLFVRQYVTIDFPGENITRRIVMDGCEVAVFVTSLDGSTVITYNGIVRRNYNTVFRFPAEAHA